MKIKLVALAAAALVAILAVPAFACGGHSTQSDNETITAQNEAPAVEATEAPAGEEPAATAEPGCACQHGQQAAQEAGEEGTEADTELTDTAGTEAEPACPHHTEAAAATDDQS